MDVFVFVIESVNHDYHHIGVTTNLQKGLSRHNDGNKQTAAYSPFRIIYTEKHGSYEAARKRQKELRAAGEAFINSLK